MPKVTERKAIITVEREANANMKIKARSTEEKAVYEAVKGFFKGENAKISQLDAVRDQINQNSQDPNVAAVLQSHGLESVCDSVLVLLNEKLFLKKKAKTRWTILFEGVDNQPAVEGVQQADADKTAQNLPATPIPVNDDPQVEAKEAQTSQMATIEPIAESVAPQAVTIKVVTDTLQSQAPKPAEPSEIANAGVKIGNTGNMKKPEGKAADKTAEPEPVPAASASQPPKLDKPLQTTPEPVKAEPKLSKSLSNLPYKAQYSLLVAAQSYLEHACFEFAQQHFSDLLVENSWDCPEAVELNLFAKKLNRRKQDAKAKSSSGGLLTPKLITSIIELRHAAVHRQRLSAHTLNIFLRECEEFLTFLGDTTRYQKVSGLRQDAHRILVDLDRDEKAADAVLETKREEIEAARRELQQLELAFSKKVEQARTEFRGVAAKNMIRAVDKAAARGSTLERFKKTLDLLLAAFLKGWWAFWYPLQLFVTSGVILFLSMLNHVI
ncbi:hypothetical protein HJFPF1_07511 [Paramyrothecium foliicola]|nr:hypothetical protein HJFPF1_07511 [Paramyrothecium foliicola]